MYINTYTYWIYRVDTRVGRNVKIFQPAVSVRIPANVCLSLTWPQMTGDRLYVTSTEQRVGHMWSKCQNTHLTSGTHEADVWRSCGWQIRGNIWAKYIHPRLTLLWSIWYTLSFNKKTFSLFLTVSVIHVINMQCLLVFVSILLFVGYLG